MKIFLFVFQIIIIINHRYRAETYHAPCFFVIPSMLIILKLINQVRKENIAIASHQNPTR